jgi:hypothetical protein
MRGRRLRLQGRTHRLGYVFAISKPAVFAGPAGALPDPGVVDPHDILISLVYGKAGAQLVSSLILNADDFLGDEDAGQQNAARIVDLVAQ